MKRERPQPEFGGGLHGFGWALPALCPAAQQTSRDSRAAMTMISTVSPGVASRASPQARAGGLAGSIQASQAAFISAKSPILASQIVACSTFDLSDPASASSFSILPRIALVCSVTLVPAVPTCPAR
jgi:hypothetical protein